MSDDKKLRSAYEIAMERLERKDREEGVEESRPLTGEQKDRIATLRKEAESSLAELEILHQKAMTETGGDPEKQAELETNYGVDRQRVHSRLESAIARVKND